MNNSAEPEHRFGFITISGPPNAGKSTLLNQLVGHKIAITSRRPQTTRHRILGVKTMPDAQFVFVDTPGIHHDEKRTLNRVINRTAVDSIEGVDVMLFMIDIKGWSEQRNRIFNRVKKFHGPIVLLINKIDRLKDKQQLLPLIAASRLIHDFAAIIPVSARTADNIDHLLGEVKMLLPQGAAGFPEDQITDKGPGFQAAELIREQLFRALGQELPYQTAVEIEKMETTDDEILRIGATIWVAKKGQKAIVIGKGGAQLKSIGQQARLQIQKHFDSRVHLDLWVKVREGWADNMTMLKSLGYSEV